MAERNDPVAAFIEAACVPLDSGHASGTLQEAEAILKAYPEVAASSVHTCAILGDAAGVQGFVVRLLIERGAPIDVRDGDGNTPLALAVRACVDSYWSDRRSPESVEALLRAGASRRGVAFPSGYEEVDALLRGCA